MTDKLLVFIYRNAKGEVSEVSLEAWKEPAGDQEGYIYGFVDGKRITYRKDRVLEYKSGIEHLRGPFSAPAIRAQDRIPNPDSPHWRSKNSLSVIFTGFSKNDKAKLIEYAKSMGLHVASKDGPQLTFLCIGPNAGPAKVARMEQADCFIVTPEQLKWFCETGEVPIE